MSTFIFSNVCSSVCFFVAFRPLCVYVRALGEQKTFSQSNVDNVVTHLLPRNNIPSSSSENKHKNHVKRLNNRKESFTLQYPFSIYEFERWKPQRTAVTGVLYMHRCMWWAGSFYLQDKGFMSQDHSKPCVLQSEFACPSNGTWAVF